jgi:signal peptidase
MIDRPLPRKALRLLGVVVLIGGVALAIIFTAPAAIGAEASYVVLSGSMAPTINTGDVVVVRSVGSNAIEEGDIITFSDSDSTETTDRTDRVTHRVIEVTQTDVGPQFVTKGDANEEPDPQAVSPSQVVGVVWFHIPLAGHLIMFAQSRYGLILFVVVPGILLVTSEVYSLYKDALVVKETEDNDTPVKGEAASASSLDDSDGVERGIQQDKNPRREAE